MEEFQNYLQNFIDYLRVKNYSTRTLETYEQELKYFFGWLENNYIKTLPQINYELLLKYQNYLTQAVSNLTKKHFSTRTQLAKLNVIIVFFRFLNKTDKLVFNPTAKLKLPKKPKTIRWELLTKRDIIKLLNAPNLNDPIAFRDRAILETLYSSGLRATELCQINLIDIDYENFCIRINSGKGGKTRVVPCCSRALEFIKNYILKNRSNTDKNLVFVSITGKPLTKGEITDRIKVYAEKSGLKKNISAQCFRIASATHMLKNKADIRYVQQFLGHNDIDTTMKYLHLEKSELKQVHNLSHPHEIKINTNL